MATYTTISNAAVAVGAIPSSTTVTALRDNPIAIAEAAASAPVVSTSWHPYNMVNVGTGTGVIYDQSINGTVSDIVTPDFEDGYEYRIVGQGLSHSNTSGSNGFTIEFWGDVAGGYSTVRFTGAVVSSAQWDIDIEFLMPRIAARNKMARSALLTGGTFDPSTVLGVSYVADNKILRCRLAFSGTSIDNGKVWLLRRREFVTAP